MWDGGGGGGRWSDVEGGVFGVEGEREGRTDGYDIPVFTRATAAANFSPFGEGRPRPCFEPYSSHVDHLTFFASGPEIVLVGTRMAAL